MKPTDNPFPVGRNTAITNVVVYGEPMVLHRQSGVAFYDGYFFGLIIV
jgi:hypothetical protein